MSLVLVSISASFHDFFYHFVVNLTICPKTRRIIIYNRIVIAVSKHIVSEGALAGGDQGIGVEEAAQVGIVVTGLEMDSVYWS